VSYHFVISSRRPATENKSAFQGDGSKDGHWRTCTGNH
jgi:hypothetical protein